ncbi:MAG: type II toxin-antitoxin system prevent-host-death family antitoxin [Thermodesulfobacteriota bacterium]
MKTVKIAELKNNLSRYLAHVRRGGSVLVLDREHPVAQLVPLRRGEKVGHGLDERLVRLERQGLIRRGTGGLPSWLSRRPVKVRGSVLQDLLAERKGGW